MKKIFHITPILIMYPIGLILWGWIIVDYAYFSDDTAAMSIYFFLTTFALIVERGYIAVNVISDNRKLWKYEFIVIAAIYIVPAVVAVVHGMKKREFYIEFPDAICPGYCGDNIVREKISTIENGYIRDYYFVDSYYYGKSDSMLVYDYAMSEIYGYLNACRGDEYVVSSKNVLMRDSLANIPLHRLRNRNNAIEMPIETVKPRISIVETGDQKAYSENNNTYFFGALYDEETKRYVVYSWIMYHIYGSDKGRNAYSYYLRNYGESYSLRLEGFDLWSK